MTPRKNSGAAVAEPSPARTTFVRLKTWVARVRARRSMPPLRIAKHARVGAPQTSWTSAFWAARFAVRARVPIDAFLQHRLSHHLSRLTVPPSRLPVTLSVDSAGTIVSAPSQPGRPPWIEAFLRAAGPAVLNPQILLGQGDAARLAARIDSQRNRVDELTRDVEAATRGVQLVDPADESQALQMGRPVVPPPVGLALRLFALALLLAESWQLAVPCLEVAGIKTEQLAAEVQRDAIGVAMGCIFAIGASATLFLLAHLALRRVFATGDVRGSQGAVWNAVASGFAVLLIVALAWSIASLRPGAEHGVDVGYAQVTLFLVLLAMPFTGAWLLGIARQSEEERARARALARAWDSEHYRVLVDVSRRAAALAEEEQRLAALESERATVIRRLQLLEERSAAVARMAADALAEDTNQVAMAAEAILAALQLDRYEYVRQACARGIRLPRSDAPASVTLPAVVPQPAAVRSQRDPEHNLGLAG